MNKQRIYGIDILRILAMYMIVVLHLLASGKMLIVYEIGSFECTVVWFIEILAMCAVNCYALISGYVGVSAKYKYSNFVMLWLQSVFYTLGITILVKIFTQENVTLHSWINAFFPVMTNQYWYLTAYAGLFILMPILNIAINKIDTVKLMRIVLLCLVVFSIAPIVFRNSSYDKIIALNNGYSLLWLALLYLFGGVIRKAGLFIRIRRKWWIVLFFSTSVITTVGWTLLRLFDKTRLADLIISYTSPLILLNAVALLMFFARCNVRGKFIKIINFFAPLCFAVYLIHSNPMVAKYCSYVFLSMKNFPFLIQMVGGLLSAILIYIVCSLIDYVRFWVFKKTDLRKKVCMFLVRIKLEDEIVATNIK